MPMKVALIRRSVTMEEVLRADNVRESLRRVVTNKGASGVDGMPVSELHAYLKENDASK